MPPDDNEEIIALIRGRLDIGRDRYGHGVQVNDDTTQYGTDQNSWVLMALEEALDGAIYLAAQMIKIQREVAK